MGQDLGNTSGYGSGGLVNIINKKSILKFTRGRNSRVKGYKKAVITLKKGQSIDLTTGI